MRRYTIAGIIFAVASLTAAVPPVAGAPAPSVVRKVLLQHDLAIPTGYTAGVVSVEIPVGGREGRHTHPGDLFVYVQSGAITLDYEGQPTKTYKAGDIFYVAAGKIHEGINNGNVPAMALASFVIPKGQPLTTQVQ